MRQTVEFTVSLLSVLDNPRFRRVHYQGGKTLDGDSWVSDCSHRRRQVERSLQPCLPLRSHLRTSLHTAANDCRKVTAQHRPRHLHTVHHSLIVTRHQAGNTGPGGGTEQLPQTWFHACLKLVLCQIATRSKNVNFNRYHFGIYSNVSSCLSSPKIARIVCHVANKSVTSWQQVGNFPVYREAIGAYTGKRV